MTADDDAQLAQLAFEVARDGLALQEVRLNELRARTGTLLTASSLLVTFLGALAINRTGLGPLGVVALVAFGVSAVLCLWILVPRAAFVFRLSGPRLFEGQYGLPIAEVHRRLAYWIEDFAVANAGPIARLQRAYQLATLALLVEAAGWAGQLAGILN
ncbi:MAG: hypothetical protein U0Y82_01310 [Thermoleophilia bacterium]